MSKQKVLAKIRKNDMHFVILEYNLTFTGKIKIWNKAFKLTIKTGRNAHLLI